jgi:long-chain acyl-CoA synthetase
LTARSAPPFTPLTSLLAGHARAQPTAPALLAPGVRRTWGELVDRVGRLAGALLRQGLHPGDAVAVDGALSPQAVERLLAVLWAGGCPVPLPVHVTDAARADMRRDCEARSGDWDLSGDPVPPYPARPDEAFNILYSSGTTAAPKGIVQEHRMRAFQSTRMQRLGLGHRARTALATPLCSNTTLIALLPSLAAGGAIVLPEGGRFDAEAFIARAVATRARACMLVPVQLRRLLAHLDAVGGEPPAMLKLCTGAPLSVDDKRALVARWPGPLVEIYGQTEGGATTVLRATEQPERLHTVGRPAAGVDLRILGPEGGELAAGETGEIVGRSEGMMRGYHGRPELTKTLTWRDDRGRAFYRTGDLGRLDDRGFLELRGRSEEVIISGGYNVFAADLERVLLEHPAVLEAAVIGIPSQQWGEASLGLVLLRPQASLEGAALRAWVNQRLGAAQRLARVICVKSLPRNAAGKVIKRELMERYGGGR